MCRCAIFICIYFCDELDLHNTHNNIFVFYSFYLLLAWWLTPKIESAAQQQFTNIAINTSF